MCRLKYVGKTKTQQLIEAVERLTYILEMDLADRRSRSGAQASQLNEHSYIVGKV